MPMGQAEQEVDSGEEEYLDVGGGGMRGGGAGSGGGERWGVDSRANCAGGARFLTGGGESSGGAGVE
jgi:hypothetical protein